MDIQEVKELINEILRSDISEFELEHSGTRVKLRRGFAENTNDRWTTAVPKTSHPLPEHQLAVEATPPPAIPTHEQADDGLHFITSPIVGTFYRASSPEAKPFVDVGTRIEEGATLCIVEAMKLMNEIPSDIAGEVARIYVENSRPVEYGQRLFAIRPRS